ncbi:hypothetical protein [Candidatus Nitronereus thalassa]|uniref:AAA+ ATPase domain-containing protein n=1 Tax=Candidatus Nitronereus thalassa TaxID=3020898 RepID=A0ABU3KBH3_9BACT|nr:hypothetical protein [Candidatus Nitronereus thalassa]MDT7043667.1 hypothetical protein [Candidatus Nitronereus thalassa]
MPKKNATPKQTGGGGFNFEDKVTAYFLACILRDKPPLDPNLGTIHRIDFQTRPIGWYLDDLLLTLTDTEKKRFCGFSIKSNSQFTVNGAPREFVSSAWEQFLHEGTTEFNRDDDILGIITSPPSQRVYGELSRLLQWARDQDSATLSQHVLQAKIGTNTKRNLFNSFCCPDQLAIKHNITRDQTGELLKCIRIRIFDFEQESSQSEREAVQCCRDSILNSSLEDALKLWEKLQTIARSIRPNAGCLDREKLSHQLRREFELRDFPCYEGDWNRLTLNAREILEGIPDKIGNSVQLQRKKEFVALEHALQKKKIVIFIGPSGSGKSVLAKFLAKEKLKNTKVLWVQAGTLDTAEMYSWEQKLNLTHPFRVLLDSIPNEEAFCVLDGLDRIMTHFQNVKRLFSSFNFEKTVSPWKLIVTCQPEEWDRIQTELKRANIEATDWAILDIKEPDLKELDPVWKAFPALRHLSIHPSLYGLLLKPKILDLFASKISLDNPPKIDKWVGESDLINWFWDAEVTGTEQGTVRGSFLKGLGEKLGDDLLWEVPIDSFPITEQVSVDKLIQNRICKRNGEFISFQHDLYGDWARQRVLIAKGQDLKTYLEDRLASPLWHRAIRLYALHLLEKSQDLNEWRSTIYSLLAEGGASTLGQDLFLEATIFGAYPQMLLEKVWPDLKENQGLFLNRLLKRFLHTATFPDPVFQTIARSLGTIGQAESASFRRIPYWPYWPAMLRFLHSHKEDVACLASANVAEVAEVWLRYGSPDENLRRNVSELSLTIADHLVDEGEKHRMRLRLGQLGGTACRAVLASYNEFPDRVKEFALLACGRRFFRGAQPRSLRQKPWPEGPLTRVDSQFQKLVLDSDALYPLMQWDSALAREIILAVLIDEPSDRYFGDDRLHRQDLCLEHRHEWFPPLYFRGPFLQFIRTNAREGLELILRLVQFATDRWEELHKDNDMAMPYVEICSESGSKKWRGNGRVYYWYRNNGFCPHPVTVALMALEKWLYDEIEQKRSVETTIKLLIQEADSVAFAGLLIGVACREPSLFKKLLSPFLEIPEFLLWETHYNTVSHDELLIGWEQEPFRTMAEEWHSLPHRMPGFQVWSQHLFLNNKELRPIFDQAKIKWQERATHADELKEFLEKLIAQYTIENYRLEDTDDGRKVWVFIPPPALQERSDQIQQYTQDRALILGFPWQCKQLLEEGVGIPPEQLDTFWASLQRIQGIPNSEDEDSLHTQTHALCGGAAVLIILHGQWIKQDPNKEAWCVEQILKTIQNPPKPSSYDSEIMSVDWQWDGFAAQALPCLWSENLFSEQLRRGMALLATSPHYGTVRNLFASTSNFRHVLGEDFSRLQHFTLRWASAHLKHLRTKYQNKFRKKEAFNIDAWLDKEIGDFITGTIPAEIPPWEDLEYEEVDTEEVNQTAAQGQPRQVKKRPGFDLGIVKASYEWAPSLKNLDTAERQEWISFWSEVLDFTIERLGTGLEEDGEIKGTPSEWDNWVISKVACLILEMNDDGKPDSFWQRILDLGAPGHYWVEDFLRQWFLIGLNFDSISQRETFISRWRQMIDYTFSSPHWDFKKGGRWYRLEELWSWLMGLRGVSYCWTEDREDIAMAMLPDFERWASAFKERPGCIIYLSSFLLRPAAKPLLLKGLFWLDNAREQSYTSFWTERDMQDSISSLLSYVVQTNETALRGDNVAFSSFKRLLQDLANRQDPVAMELYDQFLRKT